MRNLIPIPVEVLETGSQFNLAASARIIVEPASPELIKVGQYLANRLNPPTGFNLQVSSPASPRTNGNIILSTTRADLALGEEGYELTVTPDSITIAAPRPDGVFWGLQTLLQLFPPSIEAQTLQPGPWFLATGTIRDYPRFAWRGAMLDVARHFFSVKDVKRYIDLIAAYKMNRFHLHLTDDQGWRIMIQSWPRLTEVGGSKAVGNDPGGYYTQAEYTELVEYAQNRYITLVPEIDMPGHTNAALASYEELNRNGVAPDLFTGIDVGFSSLCVEKEMTYQFVDDVIREIAGLTPGPYIHIGGDEAASTEPSAYTSFVERVQSIVTAHGKHMVGWEEISNCKFQPSTIAQSWKTDVVQKAVQQGGRVIFSPGAKTYLDMKYNATSPLGLSWAGFVEVQDAYNWDPATQIDGVSEKHILGIEAPLWSETLRTIRDIEFMAFPRLPGLAEIGWSPAAGRTWEEYRLRLGSHGPRLEAMKVNFYRSPQVSWK
jgi:hexosaminidase